MSDCSTRAFDVPLKPCPFCGGEAETFNPFNADGTWCVLCSECAAATGFEQTETEATVVWNTRSNYETQCENELRVERREAERTCKLIRHGSLANMPSFICWSCSECGFGWHHSENDKQFSFCPNCGARVVGE